MRVVAGNAKGTRIKAPKSLKVRPTSGRVRGAIFSILSSMVYQPQRVLDLYSGTGALGIEALSRGAEWVDFVERDPESCAFIRENLKAAGYADRCHVHCSSVTKALDYLTQPYDLILADPPYFEVAPKEFLERLSASSVIGEDATVVLETSSRVEPEEEVAGLRLVKERRHGDTLITVYRRRKER